MNFPLLQKTSLWSALSPLGRSMETPQGIFYWSALAKKEAEIDGTIGIAQDDDGTISHLKMAEPWAGEKIMERAPKGKIFAYGPIPGLESLRKKWLAKILERHPALTQNATLPVVTNGITHSLALAGRLFLEPGQTLLTAEKSWENYEHIYCDTQGIEIVTFPLFTAGGLFHTDAIIGACRETAAMQGKVVLLLNFPHNQTGFMPSGEDLQKLGARFHSLATEHPKVPFVILLDDAYEGYVYDDSGQAPAGAASGGCGQAPAGAASGGCGQKFSPLSQIFAPLANFSVIKMDGISKVMLAYGYRVGFITCFVNALSGEQFSAEEREKLNAEVAGKIGGFIRGEISQVNHHGQVLADALMDSWDEVSRERGEVILLLASRFRAFKAALQQCYEKYGKEKVWADPCNGGFFAYFNVAQGIDAKDLAMRLLKEKKVGVVPFGQGLRVAFCGVAEEKIGRMVEAVFEVVA